MQDAIIVIAIFGAIFGIVFVLSTARNRERLAMIEKGINVLDYKPKSNVDGLLKWALLIIGLGLGFFFGNLLETYTSMSEEAGYFGSIFIFGGLGLLIAFLIQRNKQ